MSALHSLEPGPTWLLIVLVHGSPSWRPSTIRSQVGPGSRLLHCTDEAKQRQPCLLLNLSIFSGIVFITSSNLTHKIPFFDGKKERCTRTFDHLFSVIRPLIVLLKIREAEQRVRIFSNGKYELIAMNSAPQWWPFEWEKKEWGGKKSANYLATESVSF